MGRDSELTPRRAAVASGDAPAEGGISAGGDVGLTPRRAAREGQWRAEASLGAEGDAELTPRRAAARTVVWGA